MLSSKSTISSKRHVSLGQIGEHDFSFDIVEQGVEAYAEA